MKIVLLGIQGAGKSTQGNLLSQQLKLPYLSTGHIFRELAKGKDTTARYIKETINAGGLVSDEKTIEIVTRYLEKKEYQAGYILDGFPRTLLQAEKFKGITKVFHFYISDKEALWRLAERTEVRDDNSVAAIKKRIRTFHTTTKLVLNYYQEQKKLVTIDASKTIEEVNMEVLKTIGKQLVRNRVKDWSQSHKSIIALVGMSGAGKSEAADFLKKKNLPIISFGTIGNKYVEKHYGAHTEENHKQMRRELRDKHGMAAMAVISRESILKEFLESPIVLVEGLYSWEEYLYLKENFTDINIYLVAIIADKALRYERTEKREYRKGLGGSERDLNEITLLNKAQPIAFADYYILNNSTKDILEEQLERVFRKIYFT
jgi:adenylate kinase